MPVMNARRRLTDRLHEPVDHPGAARGQTLVIFALFLVVLLGAAALTIDYASWLKVRRDYQNGADAAALAGAQFLTRPIDSVKRQHARDAAWATLKSQLGLSPGFVTVGRSDTGATPPGVTDSSGYRMWVSTPPFNAGLASSSPPGKYPGNSKGSNDNTVFVWVEKDNPSYFSGVFGQGNRVVSAWAAAGSLPGRFAVITLRRNGQASNGNPGDIQIQGGSTLNVKDGDVGGNWGMAIGGDGAYMKFTSTTSDKYGPYLAEPASGQTGGNGWNANQVVDSSSNPISVTYFPEVPDPNYPLPAEVAGAPANAVSPQIPTGDFAGIVNVGNSAPGGTNVDSNGVPTSCKSDSPSIGPGYYTSISVANGQCLILDPVNRYTGTIDAETLVPVLTAGQRPGIFYVNGKIDVGNGAMILGEGVTVIMRPQSSDSNPNQGLIVAGGANSHGVVDLNKTKILGAWMANGTSPYTCSSGTCTYNSGLEGDISNVGIALYVVKRIQYNAGAASDDNSSIIKVNANGGLAWQGVTYAPHDNVTLAGQPGHNAVGQLVSWTVKFAGGTTINQTYRGPENGIPYLIEPKIGQ